MSKLKRLIKQLSDKEVKVIYNSLINSDAHKSAELLKHFKENELEDEDIKGVLGVNNNAFYTLRSRLNEKIENYFLEQTETPRTSLLKQVAAINEIMLTKSRTIAVATLKKLEKELSDYDLSNELIVVYKALKKLHIHSPEYFEYSQAYNKHIAYMLAVDKAEDLMADFFKRYSLNEMVYNEKLPMELDLIAQEIYNVSQLYKSHRLWVFNACISAFRQLFTPDQVSNKQDDTLEEIFAKCEDIFETYRLDTTYHNLQWVFAYLKLVHCYKQGDMDYVDTQLKGLVKVAPNLMGNYSTFTSPGTFGFIAIERSVRNGTVVKLNNEVNRYFRHYDDDPEDLPQFVAYSNMRALLEFRCENYQEAIEFLEHCLDQKALRHYQQAHIDVKLFLATVYLRTHQIEQVNNLVNNVQRHVRLLGKESCSHSYLYLKIMKSHLTDLDYSKKERKILNYIEKFKEESIPFNSPLRMINTDIFKIDEEYIEY